jgi:large subunit ribosomal protein L18
MKKTIESAEKRQRIRRRIRKSVLGTVARPRLAVFKSNKYIYVQVIDDAAAHTLAAASSLEVKPEGKDGGKSASTGSIEAAKLVGKKIAEKARAKGIESVVFDRGGYGYHGRVKALADAAREGGLKF